MNVRVVSHVVLIAAVVAFGSLERVAAGTSKLPWVFSDHAVLQRDRPVPVWGKADAGSEVRVEFAAQTRTAVAAADGTWRVTLDPLPASVHSRDLTVRCGDDVITLRDLLVGEVWFCSGQSNMDKPLGPRPDQRPTSNHEQEIASAHYPLIRHLVVRRGQDGARAAAPAWRACSPQSVEAGKLSAVGYFFARSIHLELEVPVGIIQSSAGGTRIEAWTSPEGFAAEPSLRDWADSAKFVRPTTARTTSRTTLPRTATTRRAAATTRPREGVASSLYRSMIQPFAPFAIRGALWYQGEANTWIDDGPAYTDKMRALIGGWRGAWGQGDFPFYFVQLAPYRCSARPNVNCPPDALPRLREAQARTLRIANTAMVVTTDLADDLNDIHPVRKREVGERLALCALARDYGKTDLVYSGPVFRELTVGGAEAIVTFDHAGGGLRSRNDKPLTDFAIAGADGKFVPADARIDGERVVVRSPQVSQPKFARFGWTETASPNLVNSAGLPAVPFRTDDLPR